MSVWVFSGFSLEELIIKAQTEPAVMELLEQTDVLVDGRFNFPERSFSLKWRGSTNQRIVDVPGSLAAGNAVEFKE
jgi:anaerobic ribonucleoside-triphosphate reductase activating protein